MDKPDNLEMDKPDNLEMDKPENLETDTVELINISKLENIVELDDLGDLDDLDKANDKLQPTTDKKHDENDKDKEENDKHDKDDKEEINKEYKIRRLSVSDINIRKLRFNMIPVAESNILFRFLCYFAFLFFYMYFTSIPLSPISIISIAWILFKYREDKVTQDSAVSNYYDEMNNSQNRQDVDRIYNESHNVVTMGGKDTIDTACALRLYCD